MTHGRKQDASEITVPSPCARTLNGDMLADMQRMIKKALSEGMIFSSRARGKGKEREVLPEFPGLEFHWRSRVMAGLLEFV